MPYIEQWRKDQIDNGTDPGTPGELNYAICRLLNRYVRNKRISYATLNEAMGALTGAELEFYRRVVVPYEETKRQENGDIFVPGVAATPRANPARHASAGPL